MIIAEQKKRENIAEYILYMYQVEDLIRANGFDPQRIEQQIINQFQVEYELKREMLEWYKGLIHRMISEGKKKTGHMEFLLQLVKELEEFNLSLLHEPLNNEYKDAFDKAKTHLDALRMRSGHTSDNDVQLALNGLYGLLILKLQKSEISEETQNAFTLISEWIALLSSEYMRKKSIG